MARVRYKICMCGYSTDKASKWDDDLDQCKACTKETHRIQKIQDYLDTFEVGDLVTRKNRRDCLLVRKNGDERWELLDPTTLTYHPFFPRTFLTYGSSEDIRNVISKRTDSDRST
jgi:hypothetical protein